ncbi:hypothetical protein UNSW2_1006 [Campylobacter concisus UNSW2]|uniref:Uncharacterized protein n=1 Tax=Campylobacter concisus UNSW2 TaxID=1242965 RepID=U2GSN8_9BACT|nr:hypothetical protein UNSW2_1006 [Campylobacter concisus UNSW2]
MSNIWHKLLAVLAWCFAKSVESRMVGCIFAPKFDRFCEILLINF